MFTYGFQLKEALEVQFSIDLLWILIYIAPCATFPVRTNKCLCSSCSFSDPCLAQHLLAKSCELNNNLQVNFLKSFSNFINNYFKKINTKARQKHNTRQKHTTSTECHMLCYKIQKAFLPRKHHCHSQ